MSLTLVAIMAGWLAVSAPVTADAEESFPEITDDAWQERLLAVKQSDRWSVGAEIGMDLVRIPGDRPYNILAANWKKIASSARKQILKGFTPGMMGNEGIHSRFFDVMHLGMTDANPGVRSYAAGYLEMQGLPNFERDAKGYARWRKQNKDRSAQKILDTIRPPALNDTEHAAALAAEGWQLWQKQQLVDAVKKFDEAVKLNPKAANAWNGLGWALFNSGQSTKALRAFEKCVKLVPKHPAGLNGLGQVYFSQGDYRRAEKFLKKAAPKAPAAWWGLTKVYLLTGDFKKAVPWAEKIAAQNTQMPGAKQMLEAAKAGELSDELRAMIEPTLAQTEKEDAQAEEKKGAAAPAE